MPICPKNHQSATSDWCEVCGIRMTPSAYPPRPAGSASSASSSSASPASTPPTSPSPPGGFASEPTQVAELCPQCGTPREGAALFCEECRYNFRTQAPTIAPGVPPQGPARASGAVGAAGSPGGSGAAAPSSGHPSVRPHAGSPDLQQVAAPTVASPQYPPYEHYDSRLSRPSQVNRPAEPVPPESVTLVPGSGDFLLDPPSGSVRQDRREPAPSSEATSAQVQAAPPTVVPGGPGRGTAWVAVIGADREYFTAMMSRSGPDAPGLYFPAFSPEVSLPLTGNQVTIGRRRQSTGEAPDIDLSRAPEDPGVSHQHAVLVQQPDGSWSVVDQNSTNGTTVNLAEEPIRPFTPVPLGEGDRVHVGAWTTITLRRA
ncbi:FHA domain-containing protein [Streptomyces sp. HPF1205]|uniref:FHA domain-containing protein n=1 Tax=Streptomyces sp. HPF1205 TaxID=2873262 RepID=UPI001CEC4C1E|nr:FHA domain-containing protein [Streptomyces sp. HPF1205]